MRYTILSCLALAISFYQSRAQSIPYGHNPQVGKYAQVNGINIYYEIYGAGEPLLLLNGNGGSIADRATVIPKLAEKYMVIAVDSRCHGKSGCSKEFNYELVASDVNALLNEINIDSTYIWGHNDGAIVGLIIAFSYPKQVKKLVVSGANLTPDESALDPYIAEILKYYRPLRIH